MKPVTASLVLLVLMFLAACNRTQDTTITQVEDQVAIESIADASLTSMKGWELYSWRDANGWYFALVEGTNRLKTFEEISAPGVAVLGWTALERKLSRLATGEEILWSIRKVRGTAFPVEDRLRTIKSICEARGLLLSIDR